MIESPPRRPAASGRAPSDHGGDEHTSAGRRAGGLAEEAAGTKTNCSVTPKNTVSPSVTTANSPGGVRSRFAICLASSIGIANPSDPVVVSDEAAAVSIPTTWRRRLDERTARVAGLDRRVRLEQAVQRLGGRRCQFVASGDRAIRRGDRPARDRRLTTETDHVADRDDRRADGDLRGIGETHRRQSRRSRLDLDQRDVLGRVDAERLCALYEPECPSIVTRRFVADSTTWLFVAQGRRAK